MCPSLDANKKNRETFSGFHEQLSCCIVSFLKKVLIVIDNIQPTKDEVVTTKSKRFRLSLLPTVVTSALPELPAQTQPIDHFYLDNKLCK